MLDLFELLAGWLKNILVVSIRIVRMVKNMQFVEARALTAHLADYLDDEAYRRLQVYVMANPDVGDVIPDAGGLRKLRWADKRRGKGRRGGLRVI